MARKPKVELPAGLADAMAKLIVDAAQSGGKDPFEFARQISGTAEASPNRRTWVHQLKKQVDEVGTDAASWYVIWNDPEGARRTKSCGTGTTGESAAKKLADKTHAELVTGTYQVKRKKLWSKFVAEYKTNIVDSMPWASRKAIEDTPEVFERIAEPKYVSAINTEKIDKFIKNRAKDPGIKSLEISPATINKDLWNLRTALRIAHDWGLIAKVPKFRMQEVAELLPTYMPPEHFAAIYQACDDAKAPNIPNVDAADWWRALLVLLYMTGWRIGQAKSLKWADADLDNATAITRADATGNKGKREERIPLHPVVVDHLRKIKSFDERVFPWNQHYRKLWVHFWIIQKTTVLPGDKPGELKPLPQCWKHGAWYGVHDCRRAFATCNAADMDLFELQKLMQHKSLATTQIYVNMATS